VPWAEPVCRKKVSERAARRFFAGVFLLIGVTYLPAFTVFAGPSA
jgi:hypothetical protein